MKYRFQLDKKNFKVEVRTDATFYSETDIRVNRKRFNLMLGDTRENEIASFFLNNRLYQVEIVKNAEGYPAGIFVDGEFYPARLLKIDKFFYSAEKKIQARKPGTVKSFIPGNIKKIFFAPGDWVDEGDIVLIHVAMKMENEIRSPKSGILKSLGVSEGDNILADHPLFEID